MSRSLFSSSLRGVRKPVFVLCVWKWVRHFLPFVVYYYFLVYLVLYVCIYGVRGGMHDTELGDRGKGDKMLGRVNRMT